MVKIVSIMNIEKKFGRVEALRKINLNLESGKIYGLVGPNGSGKSTLLKCLAGLLKPNGGKIEILGQGPSNKTKAQIGFVPEIDQLYRFMTVTETLKFTASFYSDWDSARAEELLEFMSLAGDKKVNSLSKGMKARLKLVLALARTAPLLLLDEPFSGIDPASKDRIIQGIVREFKDDQQTILISTHALRETEQIFDHVIFLDQGEVILQGDVDDLRSEHKLSINDLFKEVFV